MKTIRRALATLEILALFPAALFMTSLFIRDIQPLQLEPAHTAQRIVDWYAARTEGLWLFLVALPLAVLVIGCVTLVRSWRSDSVLRQAILECAEAIRGHFAVLIIALATAASALILGIVVLHVITD